MCIRDRNMTMEHVTVMNTRGFGLVGINVIGTSQLKNVTFFNNKNPGVCHTNVSANTIYHPSEVIEYDSLNQLGGAAAFLYFDYNQMFQPIYRGNQFNLNLDNCNFTLNIECSVVYLSLLRSPGKGESRFVTNVGYRLGGSGALLLVLAQLDYGVDISTRSSSFYSNFATFASGSLIAMFTGIRNTHVVFDDCWFDRNNLVFLNDVRLPQNVEYNPYLRDQDVSFSLLNCNLTNNGALIPTTTLLIYSNYYSPVSDITDVVNVYIDNCLFMGNQGFVGSAMTVYEYKINGFGVGIQIFIKDTNFVNNKIVTVDPDATITISQSAGIVDIRNVNLTLYGNCSFIDNAGTGLHAESSLVGVNGNVTFLRNIGINGGALHLVTYSYLIMNRNSSIYFIENEARIGGGALYVNENGLNSYLIGGFVDCFIHFTYDNFILCEDCSDLDSYGVYIKFAGNVAPYSGDVVSGSSLSTCPWAYSLRTKYGLNRSVFEILYQEYQDVFDFDVPPNDPTIVRSAAARLEIEKLESNSDIIEVFPGEIFYVNISAVDDFNHTISNVIAAFAETETPTRERNEAPTPFLSSTFLQF